MKFRLIVKNSISAYQEQDLEADSNITLAIYLATYLNEETFGQLKDPWRDNENTKLFIEKKRKRPRFKVSDTEEFKKVCLKMQQSKKPNYKLIIGQSFLSIPWLLLGEKLISDCIKKILPHHIKPNS